MSLTLRQLQNQFRSALHYQASGETCMISSDQFTADQRIQIYRNNFVMSLSEVLEATYPMLHELLGEECFSQVTRQFVLQHPLTKGDVSQYGDGMAQFLEAFPMILDAAPYSPEVARFEWNLDLAQQQHNKVAPLDAVEPIAQLSTVPPSHHGELYFHLHPSVTCFSSHYAVFSLRKAISEQNFDGFDINSREQGVIACDKQGRPWSQYLSSPVYQLIAAIQSGQQLGDIQEELLVHLNHVLALGVIAGFTLSKGEV
ncbi:DNA-binding domain-containing protein [Vibrio sonorensis]|uniref:HvfC/BufC N-terminal domain-containing protein n=1 Tax=Vibrio sonorensis TaxID=1004316 RepID=UPI0008DA2A86|nr:DNA-binding domain-containing protein [Vibrio sonorensis]